MLEQILFAVGKVIVVFTAFMLIVTYLSYAERRIVARMQSRIGPNRVGPMGLLQPIADAIKLITKEEVFPASSNKIMFTLAPMLSMIPALLIMSVIPFGNTVTFFGREVGMVLSDINVGILFVFAITSLGVYGVVMAGWSSNSKYSLLGALRSSAQMISYEVSYGLSIIGVIMIAGSLNLTEIVNAQANFWDWFMIKQPVGFLIFAICGIAETNRAPFDLPEAETELVAGYHTEYSSMKFGMFFVAEYAHMLNVSAIVVILFMGGWHGPWLPPVAWFLLKVSAFLFLYIWLRATLPRFRYDQLMDFGWKFLLPLALVNILVTGIVMAL
ncbi:MAG: NADH-quinone oxidoreductase subunit NuoH [candidate division Zixibacteria bacterium]|nr:NADH-quinone oxidoreductase subunit NuoH [candidate division Zixibacteria bacterium]